MIVRGRLLRITQQRSFHHALSTFQWNYTRAGLRRMKKPELVTMASQRQMDTTGTKNELIDRLLTPPLSSPVQQSEAAVKNTSKVADTTTETLSTTTSQTGAVPPSSPAAVTADNLYNHSSEEDTDGHDELWVEAFDLKVGNRRSGSGEKANGFRHARSKQQQPPASPSITPSSPSTTHPGYIHNSLGDPANDKQLVGLSLPHRPTTEDTSVNTASQSDGDDSTKLEFTDPEINQHWVNAFDQRVKTRTKIRDLDTLSANPRVGSMDEQPEQQQQPNDNVKATESSEQPSSTSVPSTGNKVVDVMIGSSLVAWYIMGGEGIQSTISSFFF